MVDPAKALARSATRRPDDPSDLAIILQDAFVTLQYHRGLKVNVGRFKVPLSLEGLESSAALDTERALFSSDRGRGGSYGDVRDVGVMAHGPLAGGLGYQLGFFSGTGDTRDDLPDDDSKAIAARLTYRPVLMPGLQIGGSRVWSGATAPASARRDRLGAELQYEKGPLTLKTEYMMGSDGPFEREGYYVHFAYALTPRWEVIGRYDTWDPDTHLETSSANASERDYIGGFNYLVGDHMKLQFNLVRKTFTDAVVGPANVAATRLQIAW
jgi:phosphate-selective porin